MFEGEFLSRTRDIGQVQGRNRFRGVDLGRSEFSDQVVGMFLMKVDGALLTE